MTLGWREGRRGGIKRYLAYLWPGRSLQVTLFLFSVLGLLIVMAAFMAVGLRAVHQSRDRTLSDRLALTALAAANLDLIIKLVQEDLEQEASRLVFDPQEGVSEENESILRSGSQRLAALNYRRALLDSSVAVRWEEPKLSSVLDSTHEGRPFPQKASVNPGPELSNLIHTPSGSSNLVLLAPISDREGRFSGFLRGEIDLNAGRGFEFIHSMELGSTGYIQVIDGSGTVLLTSSPQGDMSGDYDLKGHTRGLVEAGQPWVGVCYRCHEGSEGLARERETIAYYPLSSTTWGVLVRQSESESMSDVLQLQGEFLWVGLAVLVAASSLLWGSTRYVFDPVRALTGAAARISQGDFDVKVPEMRKNEVGKLAGSFEQMRLKISVLLDEERRRGEGLQVQVRKATKNLASMYEVSQTVNRASLNLKELLDAVLDKVVEAIEPADAGVLFLLNGGGGLAPAACSGCNLDDLTKIEIRAGEGVGGKASLQGILALTADETVQEIRRNLSLRDVFLLDQATASLPPVKSSLALLLAHGGRTQGVLVVVSRSRESAFPTEQVSLARSVAEQVAVGVANARLYQELQKREASRSDLVGRLITAQEEERRRVARELHDEAGQALTAVMMSAARAEQALRPEMKEAKTLLVEARSQASQALDDVRRLIFDLRPQVLDDLGLIPALRWFVKDRLQAAGVEGRLEVTGIRGRLPSQVEVTVFRVVQEALTNIIRHSGASKATVRLSLRGSVLAGIIEDNGKGLELEKVLAAQAPEQGWGLRGMEERVHLLGGSLAVRSQPGKGATIRFQIKLQGVQEGVQGNEQYSGITS